MSRIEFEALAEREHKLAREMAMAIWGIDLDEVEQIRTPRDIIAIAVANWTSQRVGARWFKEFDHQEVFVTPKFGLVTIPLDRWLVPWKLKAGYNQEINTLVYRVKELT